MHTGRIFLALHEPHPRARDSSSSCSMCSLGAFAGALIVYCIDNESSRMAYIRGTGETLRASEVIQAFVELEAKLQHKEWFGRVPSHSNPTRLADLTLKKSLLLVRSEPVLTGRRHGSTLVCEWGGARKVLTFSPVKKNRCCIRISFFISHAIL